MAFRTSTLVNNGQSATDVDGIVTGTIPGLANDLAVIGVVQNSGTNVATISDNGDGGWTSLITVTAPDAVASNTDVALWAKKLSANDVGKTFTVTAGGGALWEPVVAVAFSGRTTVADLIVSRAASTTASTTVSPAGVTTPADGYDVVDLFFTRLAAGTQISLTTPGGNQVKRAEAATSHSASPNYAVTVTSSDNVTAGAHGGNAATFNASINQAIVYTVGLKSGNNPPTANAGPDQANVEPYSTITLAGTDFDDGTIVTRAWTQTAGTAVSAFTGTATQTATAKVAGTLAGETLTFQYRVTDDAGLSATDTVNVAVLPVTERVVRGGVLYPLEIRSNP